MSVRRVGFGTSGSDAEYGLHQASFKRVRSTGSGIRIGGYESQRT